MSNPNIRLMSSLVVPLIVLSVWYATAQSHFTAVHESPVGPADEVHGWTDHEGNAAFSAVGTSPTEEGEPSKKKPETKSARLELVIEGILEHPWRDKLGLRLNRLTNNGRTRHGGLYHVYANNKDSLLKRVDTHELLDVGNYVPGTYEVLMECDAGYSRWDVSGDTIARWVFDIKAGDNKIICAVPKLCRLTLNLKNSALLGRIRMKTSTLWVDRALDDEFVGETTIVKALPTGEWTLTFEVGEAVIVLDDDTEVVPEVTYYYALRLDGFTKDGPISKFGLRPGDKLVSVNGQAFVNIRQLRHQMNASLEDSETTWSVERNKGKVKVHLNGRELRRVAHQLVVDDDDEYFRAYPASEVD